MRYVNPRIAKGEALSTFGRIIADARKALGMSQKELAGRTRKGGGDSISPQYLNVIEHDRRNPHRSSSLSSSQGTWGIPKST